MTGKVTGKKVGKVMGKKRPHADDLRGAGRLAVEATRGLTDLVEAMHRTVAGGPSGLVYESIRRATALVGAGIDLALAQLAPLLGESAPGPERDVVLAALNGVLGDYLSETDNPLAIQMRLRQGGLPLELEPQALRAALPQAGARLLIMVHGSCMNDRQWSRLGHDHGAALARDLGYTPVYLHYNSGLHTSTNGRALAALLERVVAEWPVPLDELVLLAHSMGGLVARSACHHGEAEDQIWRPKLRKLVCLGTPHHGAPLERGGSWVDFLLGLSRYSAPLARLGKIRSAGVTDLRYGNVLDEHWQGRDRFARAGDPRSQVKLPEGVACYAIAATTAAQPGARLPSDGLVPVDSALGRHQKPELTLGFPAAHQWIGFGMSHLDLLSAAEVYATIQRWLSS
jgi:pimeloyl-ACP methyl ester carboxylesterase